MRLPALVVGGGLTGIDTTTELAAYYPMQVEKFLTRWEALAAEVGESELWRCRPHRRRAVGLDGQDGRFIDGGR